MSPNQQMALSVNIASRQIDDREFLQSHVHKSRAPYCTICTPLCFHADWQTLQRDGPQLALFSKSKSASAWKSTKTCSRSDLHFLSAFKSTLDVTKLFRYVQSTQEIDAVGQTNLCKITEVKEISKILTQSSSAPTLTSSTASAFLLGRLS